MVARDSNDVVITIADVVFDPAERMICGPRETTRFSPTQCRLFGRLAKTPGKMVSYEALLMALYDGPDGGPDGGAHVLNVITHHVRRKIAKVSNLLQIKTVWGDVLMIVGKVRHVRVLRDDHEARAVDALLAELRGEAAPPASSSHQQASATLGSQA